MKRTKNTHHRVGVRRQRKKSKLRRFANTELIMIKTGEY